MKNQNNNSDYNSKHNSGENQPAYNDESNNAIQKTCGQNQSEQNVAISKTDGQNKTTQKNKLSKSSKNQIFYSHGEEWFNIISHTAGAGLAVLAAALLIIKAGIMVSRGKYDHPALAIVSVCLFSLALITMYLFSTLYHSRKSGNRARAVFRRFDHCCIPILIAGTYAPFTLIGLVENAASQSDAVWGIVIASVVLAVAVLTVVFNAVNPQKFRHFGMIAYVAMGWCIIIRIYHVVVAIGMWASLFLMFGGIMYTVGILFYSVKKIKYNHAIWHLFVIAGSVLHFISIFFFLI